MDRSADRRHRCCTTLLTRSLTGSMALTQIAIGVAIGETGVFNPFLLVGGTVSAIACGLLREGFCLNVPIIVTQRIVKQEDVAVATSVVLCTSSTAASSSHGSRVPSCSIGRILRQGRPPRSCRLMAAVETYVPWHASATRPAPPASLTTVPGARIVLGPARGRRARCAHAGECLAPHPRPSPRPSPRPGPSPPPSRSSSLPQPPRLRSDPLYDGDRRDVFRPFSVGPRNCTAKQ